MENTQEKTENTNESTLSTPVQTSIENQPQNTSFTENKKGTNSSTKILIGCLGCGLLLLCLSVLAAIVLVTTRTDDVKESRNDDTVKITPKVTEEPKPTPTIKPTKADNDSEYEEEVFYPTEDALVPLSEEFSAEMTNKSRALSAKDGYAAAINSIGDPGYNFSILYDMTWKQSNYELDRYVLKSSDNKLEYGILFFGPGSTAAQLNSCESIVNKIFEKAKVTIDKRETINIHSKSWDRVYYTIINTDGTKQRGVDQCLFESGIVMNQFIVVEENTWTKNSKQYMQLMNDIYVHKLK